MRQISIILFSLLTISSYGQSYIQSIANTKIPNRHNVSINDTIPIVSYGNTMPQILTPVFNFDGQQVAGIVEEFIDFIYNKCDKPEYSENEICIKCKPVEISDFYTLMKIVFDAKL